MSKMIQRFRRRPLARLRRLLLGKRPSKYIWSGVVPEGPIYSHNPARQSWIRRWRSRMRCDAEFAVNFWIYAVTLPYAIAVEVMLVISFPEVIAGEPWWAAIPLGLIGLAMVSMIGLYILAGLQEIFSRWW